jgi:hypothetical protein
MEPMEGLEPPMFVFRFTKAAQSPLVPHRQNQTVIYIYHSLRNLSSFLLALTERLEEQPTENEQSPSFPNRSDRRNACHGSNKGPIPEPHSREGEQKANQND